MINTANLIANIECELKSHNWVGTKVTANQREVTVTFPLRGNTYKRKSTEFPETTCERLFWDIELFIQFEADMVDGTYVINKEEGYGKVIVKIREYKNTRRYNNGNHSKRT